MAVGFRYSIKLLTEPLFLGMQGPNTENKH